MPSHTVKFYIETENKLQSAGELVVHAKTVDLAREQVRQHAVERQLPPVRAINFGPDGEIHVICAIHPQAANALADAPEGMKHIWRRPPGSRR